MDFNDKLKSLILEAKNKGFSLNKETLSFENNVKEDSVRILHVRGCSYGEEESMGNYEIYDKIFKLDAAIYNEIIEAKDEYETYEKICENIKDQDFFKCYLFEDICSVDWKYKEITEPDLTPNNLEMILRMSSESIMCEFFVYSITLEEFKNRKEIYMYLRSPMPF